MLPNNEALIEKVARQFRALAEPLRLRILNELAQGERSVNDIRTAVGSTQPNVSRHLQALFEADLVKRRRAGTTIFYAVADPTVFELCRIVCASAERSARRELEALAG